MLSDDQIDRLMDPRKPYSSAKAIERAVRKEEEALIRQMLEALEDAQGDSEEILGNYRQTYSERYRPQRLECQEEIVAKNQAAITAARARLGEKEPT